MVIKESSDELNPTDIVSDVELPSSRTAHTVKDYLALGIATCGVGYLPLAPGTWGSLVGIGVYVLVRGALMKMLFGVGARFQLNLFHLFYSVVALELFVIFLIGVAGTWAASRTEKLSGKKDPGKVVIDEVVGQFIALIPVPFVLQSAWWSAILAFFPLFRHYEAISRTYI